jgi:broad specificity phosphatase PhoE
VTTRTVVHLLRHGEVFNPTGVLYGRLPGFRLSELGQQMAERAADALADRDVVAVISSPMERAQQTAAPIGGRHQLRTEIDDRLIEASNVFEGSRVGVGDGVLRSPRAWRHLYNPITPSWGEPYVEVAGRMRAAVGAARSAARGHEAVRARPAQAAVRAREPDVADLRRRSARGHHLHRALGRPRARVQDRRAGQGRLRPP